MVMVLELKAETGRKWLFLILIGLTVRLLMMVYYATDGLAPLFGDGLLQSWGDVGLDYSSSGFAYPPLTLIIFAFLRLFSPSEVYFSMWAGLLELFICYLVWLLVKKHRTGNHAKIMAIFLLNPLWILKNIFGISDCGYHLSDLFFLALLCTALLFLKRENYGLFYVFLALSASVKWFTLPAVAYLFIKFLSEKNYGRLRLLLATFLPTCFICLIVPVLIFPGFFNTYSAWFEAGSQGGGIGFMVLWALPAVAIFLIYLFRIGKTSVLGLIFASVVTMFPIMVFARPYMRYLISLIIYGHLIERKFPFGKRTIDNDTLTFLIGCAGVALSVLFIVVGILN